MNNITTSNTKPKCLDFGKPLNAISASPDGNLIIAAGRDVFKILRVVPDSDETFKEVDNLRPAGKINLSYSTVDVQWHPTEDNRIATSATNGAVVIWNTQYTTGKTQKRERVITEHARTVNRICWHPSNTQYLLSGSQDGTMKLWDLRDSSAKGVTFSPNSTSVRDVQFNPFYSNYFGAAFENGTVQVWDMRVTNACVKKITAHHGLVMTICWHPEERSIIASGGRDRMIKVWDMNPRTSNPKYSIQTIASVGHVKWRPGHTSSIASCAPLNDVKIHVWDANKPYIPLFSLVGHRDAVTGFLWYKNSPDSTISCSKDGTILLQNLQQSYHPYDHIRTVGISWNVRNELANLGDRIDRENPTADVTATQAVSSQGGSKGKILSNKASLKALGKLPDASLSSSSSKRALTPLADRGVMKIHSPLGQVQYGGQGAFNHYTFQYLAQNYRFTGPFAEVCEHNAKQARRVRQYQIAQSWHILKTLFAAETFTSKQQQQNPSRSPRGALMTADGPSTSLLSPPSSSQHSSPMAATTTATTASSSTSSSSLSSSLSAAPSPFMGSSASSLSAGNISTITGGSTNSGSSTSLLLAANSSSPSSSPLHDTDGMSDGAIVRGTSIPQQRDPPRESLPELASSVEDFFLEQAGKDPVLTRDEHSILEEKSIIMLSPDEPGGPLLLGSPPQAGTTPALSPPRSPRRAPPSFAFEEDEHDFSLMMMMGAGPSQASPTASMEAFAGRPPSLSPNGAVSDASLGLSPYGMLPSPPTSGRGGGGLLPRDALQSLVDSVLNFYGDQGDVQTCVAMSLVLHPMFVLDNKTTVQWYLSYIELLHRLQLWSCANEVIRICPLEDIRSINQKSTTVHTSCPQCGKPLFRSGWACEHCNKPTNPCSVCHQTVKGLYVWCQGCGHGGHVLHMNEWFSRNSVCPAACAHLCSPTFGAPPPRQ